MKFERGRVHFLSDFFGLLSSRNFATMATWRDDLSSLLSEKQFYTLRRLTSPPGHYNREFLIGVAYFPFENDRCHFLTVDAIIGNQAFSHDGSNIFPRLS